MKRKVMIFILLTITVLWLFFIFSNSADSGAESSSKSKAVQEIINRVIGYFGIEGSVTEHFVRKSAHFIEFAILGVLITLDMLVLNWIPFPISDFRQLPRFLVPFIISFITAATDETLQNFSENRGPSFKDVLIDSSGALTGILLLILLLLIISQKKKDSKSELT